MFSFVLGFVLLFANAFCFFQNLKEHRHPIWITMNLTGIVMSIFIMVMAVIRAV